MDEGRVDRETACPFLLRLFFRTGGHHSSNDYPASDVVPSDELQLYTWEDCTLRELADLIKEQRPQIRRPRCELSFAIVYPDRQGRAVVKEVGRLWVQTSSSRSTVDDTRTLHSLRFQTGDYVDVAVLGLD
ncbi:hypothetical protein CTAYLR_003514 [Chrysophaeum taylorii]|uniref:Histone deacetylase complex subunit SAP18 n=1 Tax=Chrysophaeum taylorii TaxID=2483200 RepID=A0AAD7UDV3_9STRA|nr:hypothetical protein CTAYLR_003514 [Chrysophaeum taylorii]